MEDDTGTKKSPKDNELDESETWLINDNRVSNTPKLQSGDISYMISR